MIYKGQSCTKRHRYIYSANKKNLPRTSQEYFDSYKALNSKNEWPLFFTDDLVTSSLFFTDDIVVVVVKEHLYFSCPKMSDRLLYQSEAAHVVLERSLGFAEPEAPFLRFSRGL